MFNKNIDELAEIIWEYHLLNHELKEADCIFVLGSYDPAVAIHGCNIYLQQLAPYIFFTGGVVRPAGVLLNSREKTEAEAFKDILIKKGVPNNSIILESE